MAKSISPFQARYLCETPCFLGLSPIRVLPASSCPFRDQGPTFGYVSCRITPRSVALPANSGRRRWDWAARQILGHSYLAGCSMPDARTPCLCTRLSGGIIGAQTCRIAWFSHVPVALAAQKTAQPNGGSQRRSVIRITAECKGGWTRSRGLCRIGAEVRHLIRLVPWRTSGGTTTSCAIQVPENR